MTAGLDLNREIAKALGLPAKTRRATLYLVAGELPRLEVEFLEIPLRIVTDPSTGVRDLANIQFMLRLEPFSQPPTEKDPP